MLLSSLNKSDEGGYSEVLRVAVPLVISTASLTLMLFVDRLFLSWYSQTAVAASTPGGITYFTICSLFMGTAQYVNTLVAQFHGSGDKRGCARSVWQGIWFSLGSAPLIWACLLLKDPIFDWSGHEPAVAQLEKEFFSILMTGAVLLPLNASLSSFFSGRGKTSTVMWGNLIQNMANLLLDYVLIFGRFGFPEMGIRGAGIATASTAIIPTIYWGCLFLSQKYQEEYKTRREYAWNRRIFLVLLRFGVPSGIQFCLDVASFTVFILLVGRLGEADLAATNIALSLEMLSFLPMVGMSIATSTLVGEYIGRKKYDVAERSVYSALKLALVYSSVLAVIYLAAPHFLIELFRSGEGANFDSVVSKGSVILRMIAVYTLFDTVFIIFSGALKGAGDTRFAMWAQIFLAWIMFLPPVYFIIQYLHMGLFGAWTWTVLYVITIGLSFWLRFRSGRWKAIRLID